MQPIVEIGAKFVFVHHGFEVAVRGGDEAGVRADRTVAADPLEFLVLYGAQQLRLELERHLADLVEK